MNEQPLIDATLRSEADIEKIVELIELVDLAEHCRNRTKPPRAKKYRLVIDRTPKVVEVHGLLGEQILGLVNKTPDKWTLTALLHGGKRERIHPDQFVEFCARGVERFETGPKRVRNGDGSTPSPLSGEDTEFLNALGYRWELVREGDPGGPANWGLILRDYRLPPGFNHDCSDLMVRIPLHYDTAGLDMFNLAKAVVRRDGRAIPNLAEVKFKDQAWVQWSRHREPDEPWVPGVDSLATHFTIIENALAADAA